MDLEKQLNLFFQLRKKPTREDYLYFAESYPNPFNGLMLMYETESGIRLTTRQIGILTNVFYYIDKVKERFRRKNAK